MAYHLKDENPPQGNIIYFLGTKGYIIPLYYSRERIGCILADRETPFVHVPAHEGRALFVLGRMDRIEYIREDEWLLKYGTGSRWIRFITFMAKLELSVHVIAGYIRERLKSV